MSAILFTLSASSKASVYIPFVGLRSSLHQTRAQSDVYPRVAKYVARCLAELQIFSEKTVDYNVILKSSNWALDDIE